MRSFKLDDGAGLLWVHEINMKRTTKVSRAQKNHHRNFWFIFKKIPKQGLELQKNQLTRTAGCNTEVSKLHDLLETLEKLNALFQIFSYKH